MNQSEVNVQNHLKWYQLVWFLVRLLFNISYKFISERVCLLSSLCLFKTLYCPNAFSQQSLTVTVTYSHIHHKKESFVWFSYTHIYSTFLHFFFMPGTTKKVKHRSNDCYGATCDVDMCMWANEWVSVPVAILRHFCNTF